MSHYHDTEWGVPVHDDQKLFEFLILEGAQAGLSWSTILNKRENYRKALSNFDARKIAAYTEKDLTRLMADPGIVRNRLKIVSTIRNAEAFLAVQKEFGSFDAYLWRFVGGAPTDHRIDSLKNVPAKTAESDAMSKALLKRGFKFVGSTICYAFMQAVGMVNDHHVACFRHNEVAATLTQHARPAAHHTAGTKLRGKGRNTARGETRA
jgi:DNA-3-methyladenine glycosylase I